MYCPVTSLALCQGCLLDSTTSIKVSGLVEMENKSLPHFPVWDLLWIHCWNVIILYNHCIWYAGMQTACQSFCHMLWSSYQQRLAGSLYPEVRAISSQSVFFALVDRSTDSVLKHVKISLKLHPTNLANLLLTSVNTRSGSPDATVYVSVHGGLVVQSS